MTRAQRLREASERYRLARAALDALPCNAPTRDWQAWQDECSAVIDRYNSAVQNQVAAARLADDELKEED
jgi:hypothetical protein